mmetsp:Transcript_58506/g.161919  ORF Transcript_58506/g.161919 Transcript_58506/m.161919 type:complete len:256 (+) Transcript_58506:731-1498(+)
MTRRICSSCSARSVQRWPNASSRPPASARAFSRSATRFCEAHLSRTSSSRSASHSYALLLLPASACSNLLVTSTSSKFDAANCSVRLFISLAIFSASLSFWAASPFKASRRASREFTCASCSFCCSAQRLSTSAVTPCKRSCWSLSAAAASRSFACLIASKARVALRQSRLIRCSAGGPGSSASYASRCSSATGSPISTPQTSSRFASSSTKPAIESLSSVKHRSFVTMRSFCDASSAAIASNCRVCEEIKDWTT